MMTFAVGEKVVYPNQGVGMIENISTRYFEQRPEKFYLLRLFCSSMTVMVPFSNAEVIGLRRVAKSTEVTKVLAYLASPSCECLSDWKVRFKINSDKMGSGSLSQIAEVFKQLVHFKLSKLSANLTSSRLLLNDLRTLRRLLLDERNIEVAVRRAAD